MPRKTQTGFTLVELACSTAIVGALLSAALPATDSLMQRQRLQAVAETLRTDLQEVRSMAVQRGSNLQLHFETDTEGTCYIVHQGPEGSCKCDANHEARCEANGQAIRTQWLPASQHVRLAGGRELRFAAGQGTVTPTATLTLTSDRGDSIKEVISVAGRIRVCTPDQRLGGLPVCPH